MFASPTIPANPVATYLLQLSPGSRRVMAASLEVIANALSRGDHRASDFPWAAATYTDAVRLRTWLVRGYRPSTAARHLCAWRCVLREAWRLGQMSTDAYLRARDIRAPRQGQQRRGRLLEVGAVAALLDVPDPSNWDVRDAAVVAVLAGCGLRVAELVGLDGQDVELRAGMVHVRHAKGDRPRTLVLPEPLRPPVKRWIEVRGEAGQALFNPLGATGRVLPRRLSISGVTWALNRLAGRAGVGSFSPHDLRRFYGTELAARGVELVTVQRLLGHASLSTTAIYNLRRPTAAPAAADGLWEALAPRQLRVVRGDAA